LERQERRERQAGSARSTCSDNRLLDTRHCALHRRSNAEQRQGRCAARIVGAVRGIQSGGGSPRRRCGDRRGKQALKRPLAMAVARTLEWAKIRARSETLLARINVEARAARQQRAKIARAKAERLLEELTDEELYERFRNAGKDAREWPGLRSE